MKAVSSKSGNVCPVHGTGNCSGSCAAKSNCTAEHLNRILQEELEKSKNVTVDVIKLHSSLQAVKTQFNSDVGHPRFIAILSSVCRWCIEGATMIGDTILKAESTEDFRLYIIWMNMLEEDSYATAQKAAKLLNDPRVTHFYASGKKIGKIVARQLTGREGVAWDIYMFYGKEAIWGNTFPAPNDYVHQLNPNYFPWVDESKFAFGTDLKDKLRQYTQKYSRK